MFKLNGIVIFIATVLCCTNAVAQSKDSTLEVLQQVPNKYIRTIDKKIDKYSNRVSSKTIKTLTKLSRWETKIKSTLQKVNPEAAERLFGNDQLTFSSLLQKIKNGEAVGLQYRQQYDKYRDDLTTNIKYLEKQQAALDENVTGKLKAAKEKIQKLNAEADSSEAIQQFLKERKRELIKTAFQYIGNNKYLRKINAESFYHFETLKNYKEIFSDEAKTEKLVKDVLNRVPGFQNFVQKNSMLASLFAVPGDVANAVNTAGLQTRSSVQTLIQSRMGTGGLGIQEILSKNIQSAQAQLSEMKDKLLKNPFAGTGGEELPDFKPDLAKTKTLKQRLIYETNIQFANNNNFMPTIMDVALKVGYQLNDKSVIGIGAGWKAGIRAIDKVRFSSEGISLRSFIDWKLKKQFYLSGGWEMNYFSQGSQQGIFNSVVWQQSALIGIAKRVNVKSKFFKSANVQLLYDFLWAKYLPVSRQWVFRVGHSF